MVSQASIQAKVDYGFGIVAAKAGSTSVAWYRPTSPTAPISSPYLMGTQRVLFDTAPNLLQRAPRRRDKPEDWFAAMDLSVMQIGDYLVDPVLGAFFITAMDPFRPARLALCNQVLNIVRPERAETGANYYGGLVITGETALMTGWPMVVVQGTKGEAGEAKLPGDTRLPWVTILLPNIGVEIRTGDIATDGQPIETRYSVSSAEETPMGWRLSAAEATP